MARSSRSRLAMQACAVVAALLASSSFAAATSAYIEQLETQTSFMDQSATSTTNKYWLTDEVVCIENEDTGVALIIRDNEVTIVQIAKRAYTTMPFEQFKDLTDTASATLEKMGQQDEVKASVRKTGESAKIGKWRSHEVVLSLTGPVPLEVSLWYTERAGINLSDWPVLFELLPGHDVMGDAQQELKELPGFPVKRVSTVTLQGQTVIQTAEVTALKKGKVKMPEVCGPPADFEQATP